MNKVIQDQLQKVQFADLSNYNEQANTYIIKKRTEIKVEEDKCYLIHIRPPAFHDVALNTNWNSGNAPLFSYMKVDVSKKMGKMIKVTGLMHNIDTGSDESQFWSGWLSLDHIEVLKAI